jgi:hypothetical protein
MKVCVNESGLFMRNDGGLESGLSIIRDSALLQAEK